ncbi:MAG TPA: hypothetical protein VJ602_09840 [Paludibacter sp.]|nr:hypothetical protein [Bacteroidota bacterium]HJV78674.1 hypothetical protein [Paludibacter sp.]
MKFFALAIFLLPITVSGQTTTDYQFAMVKFQKLYNAGQGDSINALFGHRPAEMKSSRPLWTNAENAALLKEYGTLTSFQFIGIDRADPDNVYVYKTVFSKAGTKTTSLTLYKDLSVGTFRFITTSESISDLVRKSKGGH